MGSVLSAGVLVDPGSLGPVESDPSVLRDAGSPGSFHNLPLLGAGGSRSSGSSALRWEQGPVVLGDTGSRGSFEERARRRHGRF